MRFVWLLILVFPIETLAQESTVDSDKQSWAREPKEIVFQNDSQWEDNRWQQADVGPFLAGSIATPEGLTLKGIAIRVGDQDQATVCFDTARLRLSGAWKGGFLQFDPRRFGLTGRLKSDGDTIFSTDELAGWGKGGRFHPEPFEITLPALEAGYTPHGTSATHLPKDWAAYRGLFTSGKRVVLSYSVGETEILESPWYLQSSAGEALTRSLEIGPSETTLEMLVASDDAQIVMVGDKRATINKADGLQVVSIPPHSDQLRFKLLMPQSNLDAAAEVALRELGRDIEDLQRMIERDTPRWPDELITQGTTTETGGPYVIDSLTLPFDNPYRALLFTSGHDFFSDGSAAICTVHGDVWHVSGIDRQLQQLRWRRFATGLYQPLGLKIVDDRVYVLGRDQVTRLHDRDGDGEADFYENFNNDTFITPRNHDFVTCLDTDPDGNFYFIHAKTGVMRLAADGSTLTPIADGFRNPNGMGVSPTGLITAAPQQGTWTPESSLIVVKENGYYGFGGPRITSQRPSGWDLPMCFIPRTMDNSGGGQAWVEGDRWGPLTGQMLHFSYGQCRILLALTEQVDGVYQGGTLQLPTSPSDFESGIMRGRFNPHDGQLYVSGLRGWQSRAIRDGCFQRVRYTGEPVLLPIGVTTYANGIQLRFAERLDREMAENPDNFFVEQWNYRWTEQYGSPDFSVANPDEQGRDEVTVVSSTLMEQGYSVFLEMPNRQPVMQMQIHWLLSSSGGQTIQGSYAHTINAVPKTVVPESQITRRQQTPTIADDELARLRPGLEMRATSLSSGASDSRVARLAAFRQNVDQSPTPFLPSGPHAVQASGTLRVSQSGFYEFKFVGNGAAELWLNDEFIHSSEQPATAGKPTLLRKGHNRIRIQYASPATGEAQWRLLWKGHNFAWEPVPPEVLFHDSHSTELRASQKRREGRELFANHLCARCHQTNIDQPAMFELSLLAPDLSQVGDRLSTNWLAHWLVSPKSLEPSTTMPAMLGQGERAERNAADMAAFLGSLRSSNETAQPEQLASVLTEQLAMKEGEQLFESLGCIACHRFSPATESDPFKRVSLHYAGAKYSIDSLWQFLKAPTAHDAATEMPDFGLTDSEAQTLADFVLAQSKGTLDDRFSVGDAARGQELFSKIGCRNCHSAGETLPIMPPLLALVRNETNTASGCLSAIVPHARNDEDVPVPNYDFTPQKQQSLVEFVQRDLSSLHIANVVETSTRLVERLRCASCHDRDGQRSPRAAIVVEEGSGQFPDVLPALTWAGEKFRSAWTEALLSGTLRTKSRPWVAARMPAWPRYAHVLSHGLAAEHAVAIEDPEPFVVDAELARIGEQLTLPTGLDCRQCHAIGEIQPRGDKETQLSLGINFSIIRDRLRHEAYHRFMLDPPRYDINTKMIKLSEDGQTTKLKKVFDADAHQQFDAVWHYIQSLSPEN